MELTTEQRSALNWAIEVAVERGYKRDADALRKLLAAHSAGAQEEPYGWIGFDNDSGLNAAFSLGPAKPESWTYYFPLYTHPQPMTDAAQDALTRAKRMLEGYADSYDAMARDTKGYDAAAYTSVAHDIRRNMGGWCASEIERIERAKEG